MVEYSKFHGDSTKFDYSKLDGKIKECYGKQSVFAAAIGLSERSVSLKLNNIRGWTQKEMLKICDALMLPYTDIPSYFFTVNVQN